LRPPRDAGDTLLAKEVLRGVEYGNKKLPFCSGFALLDKPSDGLEPSTPSLPSSDAAGMAGKRGKPRARKSRKSDESAEDD
jgi:hypothetical protein